MSFLKFLFCKLSVTSRVVFKYAIAMLMLHFLLNKNQYSENIKQADIFMDDIYNDKAIASIKGYFEFCEQNLINFFLEARNARRQYLNDIKQYAVIIFLSLHYKDAAINKCLEKIYTISTDNKGVSFNNLKTKFQNIMEGKYFEKKYMNSYDKLTRSGKEPNAKEIKQIFNSMIEILESTDFKVLEEMKEKIPSSAKKLIKKLYVTDKVFIKYGYEDNDIINSKHIKNNKEIEKIFAKVADKLGLSA